MSEQTKDLFVEQNLEQAQSATRERLVGRIEQLCQDEELRNVLQKVGYFSFVEPEMPAGQDSWSELEIAAAKTEHNSNIDELVSYQDIESLQRATKAIFDLRGKNVNYYRERWESDGAVYPTELDKEARKLAEKLRLIGNTLPAHEHYDVQLNLGGAANSLLYRLTYGSRIVPALMALNGKNFAVDMEVNLGSTRPINDAERKRSKPYATTAKDEWDLAKNAFGVVYGVEFGPDDIIEGLDPKVIAYFRSHAQKGELFSEAEDRQRFLLLSQELDYLPINSQRANEIKNELETIQLPVPPNKWRVASAIAPDGHNLFAISAGLQSGIWDANDIRKIRPNTSDTYTLLSGMLSDIKPGGRVLVVTSAHFTGFQGADAERLAYDLGLEVEIIGFDPVTFNEEPKPTHELLQEIHSLVSSTIGTAKYIGLRV